MVVKIFKNCDNAKSFAKETSNVVAVEAEYGANSLEIGDEGVVYEMNHHGSKQHFSAPCNRFDIVGQYKNATFVVSHLDLDTIMGIGLAIGVIEDTPYNREFGKIAEFVDVFGLHRLKEHNQKFREEIDNFQYFLQKVNRNFEEGEDITALVLDLNLKLKNILENGYDKHIVEDFNTMKNKQVENFEIKELSNEFLRVFVTQGESMIFEYDERNIIIQLNEKFNAITLAVYEDSISTKYFGETGVLKPLKEFFGENAGGKTSIGGGDRNKKVFRKDLEDFVNFLKKNYKLNSNNISTKTSQKVVTKPIL